MTCPVEKKMRLLLNKAGVHYTRPECDRTDPTNLDFYLPDLRIYVEVKQFHTPRIAAQLARVPEDTTVIVLVGPRSVQDFLALCAALSDG